jgi:hypothetical protein
MARQIHKEQESSKEAFLTNRSIAELFSPGKQKRHVHLCKGPFAVPLAAHFYAR